MSEIDGRHAKLIDAEFFVFSNRSASFLASIHNGSHAKVVHRFDVSREWERTKDNVVVDNVPPIADFQPAAE
jgi:hypothetical protein